MKNKTILIITVLISILLFVVWATMFSGNMDQRLWNSFLINYLFFNSLFAGLVIWPAIVISAHGHWMESIEKFCYTGLFFSLPALVALIILWISSGEWAPWLLHPHPHKIWLDNTFLFSRNLVAQLLFWFMAFLFYRKRYSKNHMTWAHLLVLSYVVSFSLLGFDFIMTLRPEWYSMMMGGYFFITGVYVSSAALALLVVISGNAEKSILHDLGKLIIAFCIFTFYLMFSQLFPIWYENNPHETEFLVPRMNFAWRWISYLLLLLIYLGPIPVLLSARVKKNPLFLGLISAVIIVGMWIERWWMVSAVFEERKIIFGWAEIIPTLAFFALVTAGIILSRKYMPTVVKLENTKQ